MIDHTPLLEVSELRKHFPIRRGVFRRTAGFTKAVDGVSFTLDPGETLGLVGESGCGKTTTGRCIVRLLDVTKGRILYTADRTQVEISKLRLASLRPYLREIQMVFQDPFSSLNPRMKVREIIAEPMVVHDEGTRVSRRERVGELMESVGLHPSQADRYPHEFSGGQRQRIGLARALALRPKLIVCDEPVSALDVSVQAQVINLFEQLRDSLGIAYIFIAHDLSVVHHISHRIAVMYLGRIVELTTADELYEQPLHPYTEALLAAVPVPDPSTRKKRILLEGDLPDPANPPKGCPFHPRCKYGQDICRSVTPELREVANGHQAACHFAGQLELKGSVRT